MSNQEKVIITCAVTGSIHTPGMSEYLPITAAQIEEAAVGAAQAGAAIVHLHARGAEGRPDQSPGAFEPFLKAIKQRCDVVVNITTGGAATMPIEERVRPAATFKPEVASLNMGSMNTGLFPMLSRFPKLKYDWEIPYLEGSRERIFRNTFADAACGDDEDRPVRFHGYTQLLIDGKWVKATPAFNLSLHEKAGIAPLEFDGVNDSILHPFVRSVRKAAHGVCARAWFFRRRASGRDPGGLARYLSARDRMGHSD